MTIPTHAQITLWDGDNFTTLAMVDLPAIPRVGDLIEIQGHDYRMTVTSVIWSLQKTMREDIYASINVICQAGVSSLQFRQT